MFRSLLNKLYLKQKLFGLKMLVGTSFNQDINMLNQIDNDLKRIDVKFNGKNKTLMLLNSLLAFPT
jgi:hypothetical protein